MTIDFENPDSVLFLRENDAKLIERLTCFTVPLLFFDPSADRLQLQPKKDYCFNCSGTLVEIFNHHFILTAGHCIQDYQRKLCAFAVRRQSHIYYVPERWHSNYCCTEEGGKDFGYILIPEIEVSNFEGVGFRVFAGVKQLMPPNAVDLMEKIV